MSQCHTTLFPISSTCFCPLFFPNFQPPFLSHTPFPQCPPGILHGAGLPAPVYFSVWEIFCSVWASMSYSNIDKLENILRGGCPIKHEMGNHFILGMIQDYKKKLVCRIIEGYHVKGRSKFFLCHSRRKRDITRKSGWELQWSWFQISRFFS